MNMSPMARPRRIALLGAESTGKTQLARRWAFGCSNTGCA